MSQLDHMLLVGAPAVAPCPDRRSRDELIAEFRGLALSIAHRRCRRLIEREDVEQVATVGLINAADRFDPEMGVSFATFAWSTIEGEIKRFFRDHSSSLRVTRSLRESSLRVSSVVEDLTQSLGRSPSVEEVAEDAGLCVETVIESLELLRTNRPLSLDGMRSNEGDAFEVPQYDAAMDVADDRQLLLSYTRRLPVREQQILALRFFEQRSQAEIGARLGISQMHVSRLLNKSLTTLRELASHPDNPDPGT